MDTPTAAPAAVAPGCAQLDLHAHTVSDIELATTLGFERVADLRKLIKFPIPTMAALGSLRMGSVPTMADDSFLATCPEFHLTAVQATFIATKAGTEQADSLTVLMAETFVMMLDGKLIPANTTASEELTEAQARDMLRRMETLRPRA